MKKCLCGFGPLILPIPGFAVGDPANGFGHAPRTRGVRLRLNNPLDVVGLCERLCARDVRVDSFVFLHG